MFAAGCAGAAAVFAAALLPGCATERAVPAADVAQDRCVVYRMLIFLDSSLPRVPLSSVTGENAPGRFSDFRHAGHQWWRCQDPGNPAATDPQECLVSTQSWGGENAWWNTVSFPRVKTGSCFQFLFFNTSRDPGLEEKSARVIFRSQGDGPALDSPVGFSLEVALPAGRSQYGGIGASSWTHPAQGFLRLRKPGRFELRVLFDAGEQVGRYYAETVVEVLP